jgi:integrase
MRDQEREAVGLIAPRPMREAAERPLIEHFDDFTSNLQALGRDEKYVYNLGKRLVRLARECGWKQVKDITPDSFTKWRASQSKQAAKTLNEYLDATNALLNWMQSQGRIGCNPLRDIKKVETRGNEKRRRRALHEDQLRLLFEVAGPRKLAYLTAFYTGLRRAELAALQWGDVHLDACRPFFKVRASTTKNHKAATIALHSDLAEELRKAKTDNTRPEMAVLERLPNMRQFRRDLEAAGIPFTDTQGRRFDFHAFRHTMATNLAKAGVGQRITQELMRHSDARLTNQVYTDATLLPVAEAVGCLPSFTKTSAEQYAQKDAQDLIPPCHGLSQAVPDTILANQSKPVGIEGESPALSLPVPESPENENGSRGRTRLRYAMFFGAEYAFSLGNQQYSVVLVHCKI